MFLNADTNSLFYLTDTSVKQLSIVKYAITLLSGGNSAVGPPESISNSEVKRSCGDGSVGFPMRE